MEYRQLGRSGLTVSVVGIGCNAFGARIDAARTQQVVDAAIDQGVTFFDTADTYGLGASEELLGKALGRRRDDVVVATKFGMDMDGRNGPDWGARASRRYARKAVEASLRRLGTDHIDLYQLHQPDLVTPVEETLEVMNELVDEGKVRYLGCSNFAGWEAVDAHWTARTRGLRGFVSAQNEYSLYNRAAEEDLVPALRRLGMSLLPYFPLAYGLLTGKYRRGEDAPAGQPAQRRRAVAPAGGRRLRPGGGARAVRRRPRRLDPRRGPRRSRRPAGRRQRDRRRHLGRAGGLQRDLGVVAPLGRGRRGPGRDQHRARGGDAARVLHPALSDAGRTRASPAGLAGLDRSANFAVPSALAWLLPQDGAACPPTLLAVRGALARRPTLEGKAERRSGGGRHGRPPPALVPGPADTTRVPSARVRR